MKALRPQKNQTLRGEQSIRIVGEISCEHPVPGFSVYEVLLRDCHVAQLRALGTRTESIPLELIDEALGAFFETRIRRMLSNFHGT